MDRLVMPRGAFASTAISLLVLVACSRAGDLSAGPEEQEKSGKSAWTTTLKSGVQAKVLKLRSYRPPAPKFKLLESLPDETYYYLQMDEVSLGGGPSVLLASEGQEDSRHLVQTSTRFSRHCIKLRPPKGRWIETLVVFENRGTHEARQSLSSPQKGRLAAELIPRGSSAVPAVDFLAAGLSNSKFDHLKQLDREGLTVVSEFDGDVQLYLEPGGKTWMILLFDIPATARSASLSIDGAAPIELSW
jgi:hypothetical protein